MIDLHVQIIKNKGRKEYAILPYEEFLQVQEQLEEYEDIRCLREAKEAEKDADPISLTELKKTIVKKRKAAGKRS